MSSSPGLQPDQNALDLAQQMVRAEHTMHTILSETVDPVDGGIMESGRTVCGGISNVRGPLARFPKAVDLSQCPRGVSGTWHSHVTVDQIRNPEHSLPDMANVVFGAIDASVVVGSESSDVLIAASDQEAMEDAYRNALGVDVGSPREVVKALDDGRLPDPPEHRRRARQALSSLFDTRRTPYPEISQQVGALADQGMVEAFAPAATADIEPMYATAYLVGSGHGGPSREHPQRFRSKARQVNSNMPQMGQQMAGHVFSTAVSMLTRRGLSRYI